METPMIKDLATWYVKTKTNYPQIPLIGTKRDIDAAFTRCRIHPDDAALFSTEFSVRAHGEDVCVIFFYMVLPFGFTGSPGIFGRMMQGVKWLRSVHPLKTHYGTARIISVVKSSWVTECLSKLALVIGHNKMLKNGNGALPK